MPPKTKTGDNSFVISDHPLQKVSVQAAQLFMYPLLLALRLVIVRNRLYRDKEGLNLKQNNTQTTYVLYANHQSKLDPLIICASLPFSAIKRLMPFRFFVDNSYFKGLTRLFLNAMGSFPAHYDPDRSYGLSRARSLMSDGQTVVIFPPGMRTRDQVAKPGVSVLAAEPDVHLIPVHIDWKHRWHCHVHIGKPLRGGITHPPEKLMEYVYELPAK